MPTISCGGLSPYLASLAFSQTPLTSEQQAYLNQNYCVVVPEDGCYEGSIPQAPSISYEAPTTGPTYCTPIDPTPAMGHRDTGADEHVSVAGAPIQLQCLRLSLRQIIRATTSDSKTSDSKARDAASAASAVKTRLVDAIKTAAEASASGGEFSLLESFFKKTGST